MTDETYRNIWRLYVSSAKRLAAGEWQAVAWLSGRSAQWSDNRPPGRVGSGVTAGPAALKTTSDDRGQRAGTTAATVLGCFSRTSGEKSRGRPPNCPYRTC